MKSIKPITAVLSILLLCGCVPMTMIKVEPSEEVRNSTITEDLETVFRERQKATTRNPNLEIAVTYRIAKEESFQRRFIENRTLTSGTRLGLWLLGAAAAGMGYTEIKQGYVVLGRDLMGLGLIVPLGGTAIAKKEVGEQWRDESRGIPDEIRVATRVPVRVTLNDSSWTVNTDSRGIIRLDISRFADAVDLGKPIRTTFALVDDPKQRASFSVPSNVVAYYRTPPEIQFASPSSSGDEGVSPVSIPVVLSSVSGLIAAVDYSVTGGTSEGEGMDYFLKAGRLTIPAGDTSATIDILITDDAAVEGNESILVSLFSPVNATLGGNTMHTHIIIDNDEAPSVVVYRAGNIPTIAILDFEGLGISEQEARVLTNRLGTHMVQLGTFKVIERGQMQQVLEEQDFQLTGCTSNECAVEVGQLLGVRQMLAGSFGKIESMYLVDMRIIDVETGGILRTASYEVTGGLDLLIKEGLVEAAKRIAGVD